MTMEQAICVIQAARPMNGPNSKMINDALDFAIAALREQEEREKTLSTFLAPMDNYYKGLKQKFLVFKSDTGEMVENCFVLRPDKDPAAVMALRAYAGTTENDTLSADIINWVGAERNDPLTLDELRQMDGEPVFLVDLVHKTDPQKSNLWGGWIVFSHHYDDGFVPRGSHGWFSVSGYGKNWIAYRHRPKEDV